MIKIQYVSDLHLEGAKIELQNKNNSDLLVLAGDITTCKSYKSQEDFFKNCSENWKNVVYVAGNHEFYRGDIQESRDELFEFLYRNFKNIHFLEDESLNLGDYKVYGSTLWTDCNDNDDLTKRTLQDGMNDYRLIQWKAREHWKLRPDDTREIHLQSMTRMKDYLEENRDIPTIMVTHHGPSKRSVHPGFAQEYYMNGGYVSSLEDQILGNGYNIPLWFHGHVHNTVDYMMGPTRVLTNPRGYMILGRDGKRYTENEAFDATKTVEI